MRVIGTAGHVDHGKSTLVAALTGTHPDRLKEEREREMTIDLGFAWMALPKGEEVGIVDVPGHRDFIENMLAGVGSIDAALFVIAADEGVMPQTREHLAILDLLNIQAGVVALTKIDLVEDDEWLALVENDIHSLFSGTALAEAPILHVSSRTRQGLPELMLGLEACLAGQAPRPDLKRPRLPIDRVFTIAGFGTVVTGTLLDGQLRVGDDAEILPRGVRARLRGLQTHKKNEAVAMPGSRVAVNLSGIEVHDIQRGDTLAHPGSYRTTRRMDVSFRMLADIDHPLRHNDEVKFFIGAAEILARIRILGAEELLPGEDGWLQLELETEALAVRGDRYILRRPSPGETLGGGRVVDAFPFGRYKRFSAETLQHLAALAGGTPAEILQQALLQTGPAPLSEVINRSNLETQAAGAAVAELLEAGSLIDLDGVFGAHEMNLHALVIQRGAWEQLSGRVVAELGNYHQANPLRRGMPKEELKSRMKLSLRVFNAVLEKLAGEAVLQERGSLVASSNHRVQFSPRQEQATIRLLERFAAAPYATPSVKECRSELSDELYEALLEDGRLVQVSTEVVFSQAGYAQMVAEIRRWLEQKGAISAAEARDLFDTSRKYVLALLEHLDERGVTQRVGDVRRLRRGG